MFREEEQEGRGTMLEIISVGKMNISQCVRLGPLQLADH